MDDFKGVLFLTTNRVGLIDEALKTRIHIALAFPRLSESDTYMVWADKIEQEGRRLYGPEILEYDRKHIMRFLRQQKRGSDTNVSSNWNARQIQNALHASVVLAAGDRRRSSGNRDSSTDEQATSDETASGSFELRIEHLKKVCQLKDDFENYCELRLGHLPFLPHPYIYSTTDQRPG